MFLPQMENIVNLVVALTEKKSLIKNIKEIKGLLWKVLIVAVNLDLTYNFVMTLRTLPYEVYLSCLMSQARYTETIFLSKDILLIKKMKWVMTMIRTYQPLTKVSSN